MPEESARYFADPRQDAGLTRWVVENRQLCIIPDTDKDDRVKEFVPKCIRSMLVVPLVYEDRVLGVLYAHKCRLYHWSEHDVNLWKAFAAVAAARLYTVQEEHRDTEERSDSLRRPFDL